MLEGLPRSDCAEILGKARRAQCTRVSARPHPHSLTHSIAMAAMTVISSMAKPVPARLGRASSALPFSRSPVSRNAVRRVVPRLQAVQGPIDVQVGRRNDATGAGQLRAQRASDKAFLPSRAVVLLPEVWSCRGARYDGTQCHMLHIRCLACRSAGRYITVPQLHLCRQMTDCFARSHMTVFP